MRNPVEGCTIFVSAVFVASVVEWLLDFFRTIDSPSFHLIFESVTQETLLVGIMTLVLIFVLSLNLLVSKWEVMLNYAVMSLLLMVVCFVIIVSLVVIIMRIQLNRWRDFEAARMDVDPLLSSREALYKKCRDRFRESVVSMDASFSKEVLFAEYLKRVHRFVLARVADLSWKSWACLGLLIVINGVRSRFTTGFSGGSTDGLTSQQRLANVLSYIGFVGWGTLLLYLGLHLRLASQLEKFAEEPAAKQTPDGLEIKKPSELLFFGSMETTSHILQCTLLFMEWYLAVFALGMVFESWRSFGYSALGLYVFAIIPPIVYVLMLPWTLTVVTILASLGQDLNVDEANQCYEEILDIRSAGARKEKQRSATEFVQRPDEYNGAQLVTLHATAENAPALDTQSPALLQDAKHVNKIPVEQSGFVLKTSRSAFPLAKDLKPDRISAPNSKLSVAKSSGVDPFL